MKNYQQKDVQDEHDNKLHAESVTKYMAKDLITFKPDTPIIDAVNTFLKKKITGAPVLNDNNEVVGLIDDKDCLRLLVDSLYYNEPRSGGTVAQYMSNVMKTISIDSDIVDVTNIFLTTPFKRLLVVDGDGKLRGQISRHDVLRAVQNMQSTTWHK